MNIILRQQRTKLSQVICVCYVSFSALNGQQMELLKAWSVYVGKMTRFLIKTFGKITTCAQANTLHQHVVS